MELLKPIIDSKNHEILLGTYLQSCQEHVSFRTQNACEEKTLITVINSKLNEPSTRFVGLSLLYTFLQNCPENTVNENAISWMSLSLKGTVLPVASTCNLSYQVLSCLFSRCSNQAKHVASAVLPKLFEHLLSMSKHCIPAALNCLESCIKVYSGSCGPHKTSIEKLLIPLLEYSGPNKAAVVWKASVCMALVPQIGGGGPGGVTHQENWTKQLTMACSTLHEILDVLFSSVYELEVHNVEATRGETFSFESVEEKDPISKAYALATRFEGVVCCVQAMLLGEFGVVKRVPPSDVLSVICRGLAVTSLSLQNTSTTESLALLTLLPIIQTKLFELMRALIDCCGANLLPFGRLVVKLVLQTLKWTLVKDWKHKTTKPYRSLRTAAYRCLKFWFDCVRTVPSCEELAEIVEIACGDFRSEEDGVRLLSSKKKSKYANRNEAKRKRASNATAPAPAAGPSNAELESAPPDPTANKDVCVAALQAVQALLAAHGWALNVGSYTTLHETVLKLVLSVSCQPQNTLIPYGDQEARVELYSLLSSLVIHPHPLVASPVRMAWRLFSLGQNDPDFEVSTYCSQALSNVEKIVHPAFVPLALPIAETEEEEKNAGDLFGVLLDPLGMQNTKGDAKAVEKTSEKLNNLKGSFSKETPKETEINVDEVSEKSKDEERKEAVSKDTDAQEKLSNGDQEMIDLSDSGSNADIEEVPVEIDLADSDASDDVDVPVNQMSEVTDAIEIIQDVDRSSADDFRLVISPDAGSVGEDKDVTRPNKRRNESVRDEANEKGVVSYSCPMNGDDVPPPSKVLVVAEANDGEPDVDEMLASFVDKVKPVYEDS